MENPHKKGSMEYLDFATAQHTKATAPKPKAKAVVKKAVKKAPRSGLAATLDSEAKRRQRFGGAGLGQMLFGK